MLLRNRKLGPNNSNPYSPAQAMTHPCPNVVIKKGNRSGKDLKHTKKTHRYHQSDWSRKFSRLAPLLRTQISSRSPNFAKKLQERKGIWVQYNLPCTFSAPFSCICISEWTGGTRATALHKKPGPRAISLREYGTVLRGVVAPPP